MYTPAARPLTFTLADPSALILFLLEAVTGALIAVVSALGRAWAAIPDWVGLDPFNHPFKWTNPEETWEDDESWLPPVSSAPIHSSVSNGCEEGLM